MKTCDLHTHSHFSDGSLSPAELVIKAKELGLSALALTDHNTVAGLDEFVRAGEEYGLPVAPGCEFSTDYEVGGVRKELHVVGLFLPRESWPEVDEYVDIMRQNKLASNRRLIDALRAAGYDVSFEEAAALTDAETFNRAHVARVLLAKGYVPSVKAAFDTLLKEGNGFYISAGRLKVLEAVRFIKSRGGMAVLAHPFLNLSYAELEVFLPLAREAGLDAMETLYSEFDSEMTLQAKALACRFGLLESGGSDFHGEAKSHIALGTGRGNLAVPIEFYERLRQLVN